MKVYIVVLKISFLMIFTNMSTFGASTIDNSQQCSPLGKFKYTCRDMNLRNVPQTIPKSVEILNLSYNRIKKLRLTSFERYSNLRSLMLFDNMIQSVEPGTFSYLTDLEEIDLSNNALLSIPLELFQLPSLRNLYVDSNDLTNLFNDLIDLEKPIKAPLGYLNIADCNLQDIPDLGILPRLMHLNASINPLSSIKVEKFASMCALEAVDLTQTDMPYCDCHEIQELTNAYFHKTLIDRLEFCDKYDRNINCPKRKLFETTEESEEFKQCSYIKSHPPLSKKHWIIIAVSLAIVALILLLICVRVMKTRKKKKLKKAKKLLSKRDNNNGSTGIVMTAEDLHELTP